MEPYFKNSCRTFVVVCLAKSPDQDSDSENRDIERMVEVLFESNPIWRRNGQEQYSCSGEKFCNSAQLLSTEF